MRNMLLSILIVFISQGTLAAPTVAFINPSDQDDSFWHTVTLFMQAAADDLGVNLKVFYNNDDRFQSFKTAKQLLSSKVPPDYLLFVYQASMGKRILDIAEFKSVKSFIFNTDIHPRDSGVVGKPRQHYAYWLGHMHPNDIEAGKLLADTLIRKAQQTKPSPSPIQILGVSGGLDSTPAGHRNLGLERAVSAHDNVLINQVVATDWSPEQAYEKSKILLSRYPDTSILWGASDDLVLAALTASQTGKQYIAGGIDWTSKGLDSVKQGTLQATVGGHFMEGGWSLLMLHDHYHGYDFDKEGLSTLTDMHVIDGENIDQYLENVQSSSYKNIDFKRFSKVYNKRLKTYDFSLEAVLGSLKKH